MTGTSARAGACSAYGSESGSDAGAGAGSVSGSERWKEAVLLISVAGKRFCY